MAYLASVPPSTEFWVDGSQSGFNVQEPDGTQKHPFFNISDALSVMNGPNPYTLNIAAGTYNESGNFSGPSSFLTIYGNGATWNVTGNITLNGAFYITNLRTVASGTLTYAATAATESVRIGGSLQITGGISTSGYEHFFDLSILMNTQVTLNVGATPVFTNVVGTPRFKSAAGATAATVLTIIDSQSLATGAYTNVDMSNGGLTVLRGFIATNNNSVVNINLSGSSAVSATVANDLTGLLAGQVTCGSAYTYVAPDSVMGLLSGTAIHFTGSMELAQYSLTAQSASESATTLYTATANGIYRVTASVQTTTAGSAGTVLTTVNGSASATAALTTLGDTRSVSSMFYAAAGSTLQFTTTVSSNTGGVYRIDAAVERVG